MELNRRYTYQAPDGTISQAGIAAVNSLLRIQRLDLPEWAALNPDPRVSYVPALPESWEWVWLVKAGDYRGTFPKRVAQFWHKGYSLKAPKTVIESIGNLARQHSSEAVKYEFDMVDRFDWNAGDFGDRNSCYWGGRAAAREMLRDNGGRAIRFYEPGTEQGIGRAWLVPSGHTHILFNGYGFSGNTTLIIARIFAGFRSEVYERISLSNNGRDGSTLYINGGSGYVIGLAEHISGIHHYDLKWYDPGFTKCTNCDEPVTEDDVHYGADENPYCEECHCEHFTDCYICENTRWNEDITYIEGEAICERCMSRHYTVCETCGRDIHNRDAFQRNEMDYCETCFAELPVQK